MIKSKSEEILARTVEMGKTKIEGAQCHLVLKNS
jgi:hypothetical protein